MLGEAGVGSQPGHRGRDYVREEPKRQSAAAGGVSRRAGGGGVSPEALVMGGRSRFERRRPKNNQPRPGRG